MSSQAIQTDPRRPNFFVIGAAKCGTTSLHAYLDLHPDISMSSRKEPAFFVSGRIYRRQVTDRERYLELFDPLALRRGESSVFYSSWPIYKGVPRRIHEAAPDARLIYLVRDPVERVPSQYVQQQVNREPGSLRYRGNSLGEVLADLDPTRNPIVAKGLYMTQIRQYLEFFPKESILVLDSDELLHDRKATLDQICQFLEVGPMPDDPRIDEERNRAESKAQEAEWYVRLAHSASLRSLVDRLPGSVRDRLVRGAQKAVSRPFAKPELDPADRARLEELFRPEVEELREFTGKSFSGWSI